MDFLQKFKNNNNNNNKQGTLQRVCLACFKHFYIILSFCLLAISIICYKLCEKNMGFANFFTYNIARPLRIFLANITSFFPFSIGEVLVLGVIIIPVIKLTSYCILIFRKKCGAFKGLIVFMLRYFSFIILFFSICICNFFVLYKQPALAKQFNFDTKEITPQNLYDTATVCANTANKYAENQLFLPSGASIIPYSHKELCKILNMSYLSLSKSFEFITPMISNVKPLAVSPLMTYTHISGMYMPFSGEANVNTNYPDYVVAFTFAHEMAHQRGIASEDEANFIGFLAMINSNDDYLIYSASMTMLDYLLPELYKANAEMHQSVLQRLGKLPNGENYAYGQFFKKYSSSKASQVASKVNDTYLKTQGKQAGIQSYSECIKLLVAYFKNSSVIK